MTLHDEVNVLDPFTHTLQDAIKIWNVDFFGEHLATESERVRVDETFCTLVAVGGRYLEKNAFKMVLQKIDGIRNIIRV